MPWLLKVSDNSILTSFDKAQSIHNKKSNNKSDDLQKSDDPVVIQDLNNLQRSNNTLNTSKVLRWACKIPTLTTNITQSLINKTLIPTTNITRSINKKSHHKSDDLQKSDDPVIQDSDNVQRSNNTLTPKASEQTR